MPLGQEVSSPEEMVAMAPQDMVVQIPDTTNIHNTVLPQPDSELDCVHDRSFYLAVSLGATAVSLPILSSLRNPIARDCFTFLDAFIWLLSAIFIFHHNYYHSRSRLFRNGILAVLIFGLLVANFQTALSDAYSFIPLAVNVAIIVNAQDVPWTWAWPRRRADGDLLPFHNRHTGIGMQ